MIMERELNWFQNYLTGRHQFVHINGASSSTFNVHTVIPQPSAWALFNPYVLRWFLSTLMILLSTSALMTVVYVQNGNHPMMIKPNDNMLMIPLYDSTTIDYQSVPIRLHCMALGTPRHMNKLSDEQKSSGEILNSAHLEQVVSCPCLRSPRWSTFKMECPCSIYKRMCV